MEQGKSIWMDGKQVDWKDSTLHFVSNSFQYGFSVFEGIRAYKTATGPAVFRLDAHIKRLFNSAKIIGLDIPFTPQQVSDACCETATRSATSVRSPISARAAWTWITAIAR
jgi:branched-chain amino acid aminotransferase